MAVGTLDVLCFTMLNARRLVACTLVAVAVGSAARGQPAVDFDFYPAGGGCGPQNVEGWEFQTTSSITVSALGAYDAPSQEDTLAPAGDGELPIQDDGLNFAVPVGVYDSACSLLASVTVPAGTAATVIAHHRYVGIAPVVLPAGQTFRIGGVFRCDDNTPVLNSLDQVTLDSSLTGVIPRRVPGGSSLECPTQTSNLFFSFGPNFIIGPACGNGVVQGTEQCDDGNNTNGDCCSSTCEFESEGSPCATDGQACSDDVCDGSGTCTHDPSPSGTPCRPAAGECDVTESCDGSSPVCPPDGFEPNGTPCTNDGAFCSGTETCQNGSCASSGNPCAIGVCDEAADQCVAPSATPTRTAVATATVTSTASITPTQVRTATRTVGPPATATRTGAATPTSTPPAASTQTRTATATASGSAPATATRTNTATGTLPPGGTATATPSSQATTPASTPTDTPAPGPCTGDCDGSFTISINELIIGVNIALGSQSLDLCPAFDPSGNGRVEINELISAVNKALNGCA
jgi:cysteine-rich repeat protein